MRLTPPTNTTFTVSILLGIGAVAAGIMFGFATSSYIALAGLVALAAGNLFERL